MKKNSQTRFYILSVLLVLTSVSCSDDLEVADYVEKEDPGMKNEKFFQVDEDNILVLEYTDFNSAQDVTLNTDTTVISIDKSLLDKNPNKLQEGSILNCVLGETDQIFFREVTSFTENGSKVDCHVKYADLSDVFRYLDIQIGTDPYYNPSSHSRAFGGYMDKENCLHPYSIITTHPDGRKEVWNTADEANTRFGDWGVDKTVGFDQKQDQVSKKFSLSGDKLTFGIEDASFRLATYMRMRLQVSWFVVPDFFETQLYGNYDLKMPFHFTMNATEPFTISQSFTLHEIAGVMARFSIMGIKFDTGLSPTLSLRLKGSLSGTADIKFGFDTKNSFEVGAGWKKNSGFYGISTGKSDTKSLPQSVNADVDTQLRVELAAGIDLYMLGGRIGAASLYPYSNVFVSAYTGSGSGVKWNVSATWGVDSNIYTHLKVLGYNVLNWEKEYAITPEYTLFNAHN